MSVKNRAPLADRVVAAASAALRTRRYARLIDVFVGMGWLDPGAEDRWRQGRLDFLEEAIQTSPARVAEAIRLFDAWAAREGLLPSETAYVARVIDRRALRISKAANPAIERAWRTHWIAPELGEKARERIVDKANRPPEIVAISARSESWKCNRCGGGGGFLVMENGGPSCLRCVGLGDLEFLPAGDANLTRRAKAASKRYAVVVRFSKTRGRYERQGLLLEPQAMRAAGIPAVGND